jgi:hypothetical protein
MTSALAACSHAAAASATVVRVGARRVPRRTAECASARQARAAEMVRKVFRIVFRSRWEKTWAW